MSQTQEIEQPIMRGGGSADCMHSWTTAENQLTFSSGQQQQYLCNMMVVKVLLEFISLAVFWELETVYKNLDIHSI